MAGAAPPSEPGRPADGSPAADEAAVSEQRRRRIAEVFGDVLPETTSDERDDAPGREADDNRFLADRPPHHDQER